MNSYCKSGDNAVYPVYIQKGDNRVKPRRSSKYFALVPERPIQQKCKELSGFVDEY